jgi:hypothetical protein
VWLPVLLLKLLPPDLARLQQLPLLPPRCQAAPYWPLLPLP